MRMNSRSTTERSTRSSAIALRIAYAASVLLCAVLLFANSTSALSGSTTTCLTVCHAGMGSIPNVAAVYYGEGENAGHAMNFNPDIVADASGATVTQGSVMPCDECHVAHGTPTSSIYLFSEARSGGSIATIRGLCEGCHRPSDSSEATPTVCGLTLKRLSSAPSAHASDSDTPCSNCHGSTAHAPQPHGGSASCGDSGCHDSGSHQAHLLDSDAHGPGRLECDDCHMEGDLPYFKSGTDGDEDGRYSLAETDACDTCHSPGGSYNGVDSTGTSVGAKDYWDTRVYETTSTLQAGLDKWCVGCHDTEPAVVNGVAAPAVAGDESAGYTYGVGWGFYKTGHGVPSSETMPSNGYASGAGLACDACHDFSLAHIDGEQRSFSATGTPATYRSGYRLDLVGGQDPMAIPWTGLVANDVSQYRLCSQSGCHDTAPSPFTTLAAHTTNCWNDARGDLGNNMHAYHLSFTNQLRWSPDWGTSYTSRISCPSCHNVHGSKYLAMIRDGELESDVVERRPGLRIWYWNSSISSWNESNPDPPTPEDIPLAASEGWVWRQATSSNLCSHCHGNNNTLDVPRALWQPLPVLPTLDWTGQAGYESDGVSPDSGSTEDSFVFRISYSDANNDAPSYVRLRIDLNDDGDWSDAGETVDMAADLPTDTTYYNGNCFSASVQLAKAGDDSLDYYFEASDGVSGSTVTPTRSVTVTNAVPELTWTGETGYTSDGVNPNSGPTGSDFAFRVSYTDADGEMPSFVRVLIDQDDSGSYEASEAVTMTQADAGDADVTDGKVYAATVGLEYAGDGALDYAFRASDGLDDATGAAVSDSTVTVLLEANTAPVLAWTGEAGYVSDGVDPDTQAAGKPFPFRVLYSDIDDDAPGVAEVWVDLNDDGDYDDVGEKRTMDDPVSSPPNDGDYTNGEIFAEEVHVAYAGDGTISYLFYFEDANSAEASGIQATPRTLTVFDAIDVPGDHATIQAAVNAASAGDTVLVADGTWGSFAFNGKDITVESVNGSDSTTITGSGSVVSFNSYGGTGSDSTLRGFTVTGGTRGIDSNASDVVVEDCIVEGNTIGVYHSSASADPISFDDCVIRNNTSHGIQTINVAAILNLTDTIVSGNGGDGLLQGGGVTVIERCEFTGNSGAGYNNGNTGANATLRDTTLSGNGNRGIYAAGGTWVMERSAIASNTATGSGAGWYVAGTINLTMTDSFVQGNSASADSGGIHFNGNASCVVNIDRTYVRGNTASAGQGGGIFFGQGAYNLRNVMITGNYAATNGGGAAINNGGVTFTNCTFAGNSGFTGGAIWCNLTSSGQSKVHNTVLWGDESRNTAYEEIDGSSDTSRNRVQVQYTDIAQTFTSFYNQTGNMTQDPNFETPVAAASAPTVSGDYHLQAGSSVKDLASATYAPDVDIDGDTRPQDAADDIGADEIAVVTVEEMTKRWLRTTTPIPLPDYSSAPSSFWW